MGNKQIGIKNFRWRLVVAIRDCILRAVDDPRSEAHKRNIPVAELGPIADLSDDQRAAFKTMLAHITDEGIYQFLYGLDNQPDGFVINHSGIRLNGEEFALSSRERPLSDESAFDESGNRKMK